jgi:two-component system KDP operon response regulator KdpE
MKPFKQLEFLSRVKALIRRQEGYILEATIQKGKFKLAIAEHKLYFDNRVLILTRTECQIFATLLTNSNMVVSYTNLSRVLWGTDYPGSVDAIRVYLSRIRQKIESDQENPSIIENRPGIGYLLKL